MRLRNDVGFPIGISLSAAVVEIVDVDLNERRESGWPSLELIDLMELWRELSERRELGGEHLTLNPEIVSTPIDDVSSLSA